jgi:hypothetical protein
MCRGGIDRGAPTIVRARDFLLKTQKLDGSWPMTSQPPNSGAGNEGTGDVAPITLTASAWALLGLLQRTPAWAHCAHPALTGCSEDRTRARVGGIDRSIGERPCARRCRRTEARKTER